MCTSRNLKLATFSTMLLILIISLALLGSTKPATHAAGVVFNHSTKIRGISNTLASNCKAWNNVSSPNAISDDILNGVAANSTSDVWSVGYSINNNTNIEQTFIEHGDGTSWSVVSSPNPSGSATSALFGVAAISTNNIWAVGYYQTTNISPVQTLVEQWNGTSWKIVPSPNTGNGNNALFGVTNVSNTTQLWAVGWYKTNSTLYQTLIEQWNGTSWNIVPSPSPGSQFQFLGGVTANAARSAWAVGAYTTSSTTSQTLVEHWNGKSWKIVSSPSPGQNNNLDAVSRIPRSNNLLAVGDYTTTTYQTLIEQWNGMNWNVVPSPNIGTINILTGVTAISASNAWAVGYFANTSTSPVQTLIEHWNGTSWSVVSSPNVGTGNNYLNGVVNIPFTNKSWTVGYDNGSTNLQTLTEFYC